MSKIFKLKFSAVFIVMLASVFAMAQYDTRDQGQYRIVNARYGTERNNVDVTARLRDLARQDYSFRMGNSTFGVDPAPGQVKTLRIVARGPRGETRTFDYREGSVVDGRIFSDWRGGGWGGGQGNGHGNGRGNGNCGWNGGGGNNGDDGSYRILSARYGTSRRNVDVTQRLRELARSDVRFRMGNSTFGVDPDPGTVKTLRIYARGPRGEVRTFEYREGSTVDGSTFTGWGRGDWANERWNGGWDVR